MLLWRDATALDHQRRSACILRHSHALTLGQDCRSGDGKETWLWREGRAVHQIAGKCARVFGQRKGHKGPSAFLLRT